MKRTTFVASVGLAFIAGCGVARWLTPASAADPMTPQIIHVPDLTGDALGAASPIGFRSKMFVSAEGMTISVQVGDVPKHLHPNTNEFQYILEGTGTIGLATKR